MVQDLSLDEISSERRNPILADVMGQLGYMEKRGSGLKKICHETEMLHSYKSSRKPVFKSNSSQFITIIFSMEYDKPMQSKADCNTSKGLGWDQVGTKLGLSWDDVEKMFVALQKPLSLAELKVLYGWSNSTKFKDKYLKPLLELHLVEMAFPNKPTSPHQKYFLSNRGKELLVAENGNVGGDNDVVRKISSMIASLSDEEKLIARAILLSQNK